MSEAAPSFGLRFFNELRRLTASTFGVSFSDISRLERMERQQVLDFLGKRPGLGWTSHLDPTSPEDLAAAIVREGQARAEQVNENADLVALAGEVIGVLLEWSYD